jgi:gluconokinase
LKFILSVDIGTTSAKALVINQAGEVLATAREYYRTQQPQKDFFEQDPDQLYNAVRNIIREAATKVNGAVDGVCFSSAMHSLLVVDHTGAPVTQLMIWADLRSKQEAHDLIATNGQKIYEETGTPIHAMSPLCKIIWLRKNRLDIFKKTSRFIGIKEYIWFKLFNEFAIDHSVATATGLFNYSTKSWSRLALDAAGIDEGQLSTPYSVYKAAANLSEAKAKDLGLSASVQWVLGASDGCLANLGSDAMDDRTLSLTIGTSGAVRKSVVKHFPDKEGRTFHYLLDEKTFITGGATNNGAILVQWFSENFLKEKVDVKSFGERASAVPAGSEGLIFLPYVLGERAPVYDPDASGVYFGIKQTHTVAHFMRALLEGVGYALYSIAEIVANNSGPFDQVIASGGFIKSPEWLQIIADIFGKEVIVRGTDDASALGAALMGFRALKAETSFRFPSTKTYYPDKGRHETYRDYFTVFGSLYKKLEGEFHLLNKLTRN